MEQVRVESWRTMEVEPIYQELAEQIEGEPRWAIPRLLNLMIPLEEKAC